MQFLFHWLLELFSLLRYFVNSLPLPSKSILAPIIHPVPSFLSCPSFSVVLDQTQSPWSTCWFPPHSVFFFLLLSLMLTVSNWPFITVYSLPCLVMEVEGSARQLRIQQAPTFNLGTQNFTRAALSCPAFKNKIAKKGQEYNMLIEDRIPWHFLSNTTVKLNLQFKFGQQRTFAQRKWKIAFQPQVSHSKFLM